MAEEPVPELHVHELALRVEDLVVGVVVERVAHVGVVLVEIGPDGEGALVRVLVDALGGRVAQERAEQARVGVQAELEQHGLVELEGGGKLTRELIDAVEPLEKDRTAFVDVRVVGGVAVALRELVAVEEPVDLDERAKARYAAIVRVEEELGEREYLRRPIPAVRAVHEHGLGLLIDGLRDRARRSQYARQVVQPASALQLTQQLLVVRRGRHGRAHRSQRLERAPDHVYVLQVHELNLAVGVVLGVLVAAALDAVRQRHRAEARVHDEQHASRGGGGGGV